MPLAVLFDLDGTLIDTIELLLGSMRHAFASRTHAPTEAEWIAGIGTPLVSQLRPFAADADDLLVLRDGYRRYQLEHHDRLTTCFDGVHETLALLHRRGHPMAVVTSKGDEIANRSLKHVGLDRYMSAVIGCDSCSRHKPDPEPVLVALDRLGREPDDAVFVGDSPHDVASGNAAGVSTIAALWGPFTRQMLQPARPDWFLERISDLPALLDRISARRAEAMRPGF